jgi:hypothetical protein
VDERDVVDVTREVREDLAHERARFAVLRERERRLHERADLLREEAGGRIEAVERLAVALGELGLPVPRVDVARPAVDEEPDHARRARREVRRLRSERTVVAAALAGRPRRIGPRRRLAPEQLRHRELSEVVPGAAQQLAARRQFLRRAIRHGRSRRRTTFRGRADSTAGANEAQ